MACFFRHLKFTEIEPAAENSEIDGFGVNRLIEIDGFGVDRPIEIDGFGVDRLLEIDGFGLDRLRDRWVQCG